MILDSDLKIIIPARKGSKRLPNKHFRELNGIPLYRYTFDYLLDKVNVKNIWLNTDDEKLISIAKDYGFNTLKRPSNISGDLSKSIDFMKFQMDYFNENNIKFKAMALLQLTNPFRPKDLIEDAYSKFVASNRESLTSFSILKKKVGTIEFNNYKPFNHIPGSRIQDIGNTYFENGLIYIVGINAIVQNKIITQDTYSYILNSNHGHIDIDNEIDLKMAELYIKLNLIK